MPKHRVTLIKTITCVIDVETDDETAAIDEAYADAPRICAQCGGWKEKWNVDDDMDWMTLEEFHGDGYNADEHGRTVETEE